MMNAKQKGVFPATEAGLRVKTRYLLYEKTIGKRGGSTGPEKKYCCFEKKFITLFSKSDYMKRKNSIVLLASIVLSVTLCSLSLPQQQQHEKAKNLKVLPKNTSHEELEKVMREFKDALGVKCNFCHAPRKDDPKKLDFASDENDHKKIARDMMRMTARINKKFFKGHQVAEVTCYTCHRGNEEPLKTPPAK